MSTVRSIEWLAGVLEGEGCFGAYRLGRKRTHRARIALIMTDEDVVADVSATMGLPYRKRPRSPSIAPHHKDTWMLYANGEDAVRWMKLLRPHMHARRQQQIDRALALHRTD